MKLQDAQDKLNVYEQRSAEQTRLIADLTNKVRRCFTPCYLLCILNS